ncbi:MAG: beta-ketoacyl-ACP synthase II [Parachlamydiaceae bacterium]
MNQKRIVVTGMGIVSCFGNDVDVFYQNLLAGKSGVVPITEFCCEDYPTRFAAVISDFETGQYMDKKQARRVDKSIAYTMVAGKKSLEHAGLVGESFDQLRKDRCGILIGSGMGGMTVFADGVQTLIEKGARKVSPFFVPYILTNMGGAMLGIDLGFMGPNYSISTACATANYSIISAAHHLRKGDADLMIAGGVEAAIIPMGLAGFSACKALSQRNDAPEKASRPWDRSRDGFVMGEGAGVLVLETLEHALDRGATILAEYLGGGISCDAHHLTDPRSDGEGVAACIRYALNDAATLSEEINYINAHATSTPVGDMAEVRALKKVFKDPALIYMNSTKSMIGHLLGAAGGVEAIATIKAITDDVIHPTINLENPEPELGFKVSSRPESIKVNKAMSNSFGFGGHNASIIFAPYVS